MECRFKTPISVHFLIHKNYQELIEVRKFLYGLLCRDTDNPQIDGLDIPVFFHIGGNETEIPSIISVDSEHQIIVPLVDECMFCDSTWEKYMTEFVTQYQNNKDCYTICPVSLFKYAFQFNSAFRKRQFIELPSYSILTNRIEFQIRLFDVLIRHLKTYSGEKTFKDAEDKKLTSHSDKKLKVFISHSKHDADAAGKKCAMGLRNYLGVNTKLNYFFDANDILDGEEFDKTISDNVKNSIFVLISSDTYSEREWCRYEALASKYERVPSIRVDATSRYCPRIFPYMANIPSIRFHDNWNEIISLMLRTTLDWQYQKIYLSNLKNAFGNKKISVEATVPELISVLYSHKDSEAILYPEPPMGKEELEMFSLTCPQKKFYTPMQLQTDGMDLRERKVAISISEPSIDLRQANGIERLNDLATELVRHLLTVNAKLLFGGNLRKDNSFTKIIGELSFQYLESQHVSHDMKCFKNYFAWPIWMNIDKAEEIYLAHNRVEIERCVAPALCSKELSAQFVSPNTKENKLLWAESLTTMRTKMETEADSLIAIGGRLSGFKGYMPGIIQEVGIASELGKPIYIIGAFGGAAGLMSQCILKESTPEKAFKNIKMDDELVELSSALGKYQNPIDFLHRLHDNGLDMLNNGLSEEENRRLLISVNLTEIVSLVLKGLSIKC